MIKILIIQLSALGDIIYTLYNVKKLYYSLNNCKIDWLYESKNDILANQKELNQVINLKNLNKVSNLNDYDYIIDLGTKSKTLYLKFKLSGIKIGFRSEKKKWVSWFNDYNINFNHNLSVIENQIILFKFLCKLNNCDFNTLESIKLDYLTKSKNEIDNYIRNMNNIIILNPNSSKSNKEITIEQWLKLFEIFKEFNYSFILIGIEFGEKGEKLSKIVKESYSFINILPRNLDTLSNLGYLINNSCLVISPDTSILHLAEFQKINCIGYFTNFSNKQIISWGNSELESYQLLEQSLDLNLVKKFLEKIN